MTPADMGDVLSAAGIYDGRTISPADVAAWHAAVGQYDREDALAAVVRHYADSTDWMKPAHLKRNILAIRNDRANARQHPVRELPSRFEKDQDRDVRIIDGIAVVAERWKLPEDEPEPGDLHGIALQRARRERGKRQLPKPAKRTPEKRLALSKLAPPPWTAEAAREVQAIAALHEKGQACGRPNCLRANCQR